MKKAIIVILFIALISTTIKGDNIVIPDDAIRFRVIANSNSDYDQQVKKIVRDDLEQNLYKYLINAENITDAKELLTSNINNINKSINNTLISNNINYGYNTNLGMNYFPLKEYKGITYEEGNYESLVVTLGQGTGENWWCVLFPPLCLLEAEENTTEEVEYKSLVKELIDKFMK